MKNKKQIALAEILLDLDKYADEELVLINDVLQYPEGKYIRQGYWEIDSPAATLLAQHIRSLTSRISVLEAENRSLENQNLELREENQYE